MLKIYKMNDLPTSDIEEGNIYYIKNKDNENAMDVYVVGKDLQLNKISTTNGTELKFDDSTTIDEELTIAYEEHCWINQEGSQKKFVDIWRGDYLDYLNLTEDEKSELTRILITR